MSTVKKTSVNTNVYGKLDKVNMTPSEREEALYALGVGEEVANAILWISQGIKGIFANAAPKANFRQNIAA